jgi:hypothetical protein
MDFTWVFAINYFTTVILPWFIVLIGSAILA